RATGTRAGRSRRYRPRQPGPCRRRAAAHPPNRPAARFRGPVDAGRAACTRAPTEGETMSIVLAAQIAMGVIFSVAAVVAVIRIASGPSILDRMIGSDVLLATIMCALAADMVLRHNTNALPILLVLA